MWKMERGGGRCARVMAETKSTTMTTTPPFSAWAAILMLLESIIFLSHSHSLPLSLCCYPSVALNASMLLCAVSLFGCMRMRVSLSVCVCACLQPHPVKHKICEGPCDAFVVDNKQFLIRNFCSYYAYEKSIKRNINRT